MLADITDPEGRAAYERDQRSQYDRDPEAGVVLHQFGAWFVTDYGVEGLNRGSIYAIEAHRLWEEQYDRHLSWETHLANKPWVTNPDDVRRALAKGREVHAAKKPA